MIESKDTTAVGRFQKTHALKGELNAILDVDAEFFSDGNPAIVEIDGILVPFYMDSIRPKGSTSYLVKLDGIDSEDEARQFVNHTIYAEKSKLAEYLDVDEEEIRDSDDLEGYKVVDHTSGDIIGTVSSLDTSTANTLFIVDNENGDQIFIPAVDDLITEIDDENRIIYMNLPQGLIDLNNSTENKD